MKKTLLLGISLLLTGTCLAKEVTAKFGYEYPNGNNRYAVSTVSLNEPGYYTCTVTNKMQDDLNSYFILNYYKKEYVDGKKYPHLTLCRQGKTSHQYTLFAGQTSQPLQFSGCISNAGAQYTKGVQFVRVNPNGTVWSGADLSHNEPGFTVHCNVQTEIGE